MEEEAKRQQKEIKRKDLTSRRTERIRSRQPPTYFAVLVGKLLFKFGRKPKLVRSSQQVTPQKPMQGYVERDFIEEEKITPFTIVKEDLQNLPHTLFRIGMKPKPKKDSTNIPPSDESYDQWREYFEGE